MEKVQLYYHSNNKHEQKKDRGSECECEWKSTCKYICLAENQRNRDRVDEKNKVWHKRRKQTSLI